jgi:hypothetical protein
MVFKGEIYNFGDLRAALVGRRAGVQVYRRYGDDAARTGLAWARRRDWLPGMFAFA